MLELILDECKQDPDPDQNPVFKILIFRIRIRPKTDRIRNPCTNTKYTSVMSSFLDSADSMPGRAAATRLKIKCIN